LIPGNKNNRELLRKRIESAETRKKEILAKKEQINKERLIKHKTDLEAREKKKQIVVSMLKSKEERKNYSEKTAD